MLNQSTATADQIADLGNFGYKQELKRTLGLRDLTVYGMVFMAPLAPFQVYGMVAQQSYGMSVLVYIVGVLAMFFTAFSYASMSREFPIAGSVYSYIQRAVNPHIGFVAGFLMLADYILLPALLYEMSGVWMTGIFPQIPSVVWALIFIVINTFINVRGITLTAKTNLVMFYTQVITIIVVVAVGIVFVFINGHGTGGFTLDPIYQSDKFTWGLLPASAAIAVLGFLGFDGISTLAEEAHNPRKNIGLATVLSIFFIGIFFIAQAYIAHLIHPIYSNLDPNMGYFDIMKESGGYIFYVVLIVINVLAIGGAVNLNCQAAAARVLYSMSRDNLLPFSGIFKKVHPKFKSPVNATYLSAVICALTVLTLSIDTVLQFVNFGALTAFMVLNLGVIYYFIFKKKQVDFKSLVVYFLLPLFGFIIILYVWSGFQPQTFIFGAIWGLIGVIIGMIKSNFYKKVPPALQGLE